jgi:hypothetical protein
MLLELPAPLGETLNKDIRTLKQFGIQKILQVHIITILPRLQILMHLLRNKHQHLLHKEVMHLLRNKHQHLLHKEVMHLLRQVILADHT